MAGPSTRTHESSPGLGLGGLAVDLTSTFWGESGARAQGEGVWKMAERPTIMNKKIQTTRGT